MVSSLKVADCSHEIRGETHLLSGREELLDLIDWLAAETMPGFGE